VSSDNFDGPDWSAGGREAYDNADNRLREGRGGSGRGQGGGNSRQQRASQQGGYSQQPGRYNGPRGGDGRQGGSQQDPYGGRQGGQDRQGARGYSGGRGYQGGGSGPQDGRGGYGSGQQGGGPQSARRGRGDSADATRAQPGGRGGFGPGGSTGRHGSGRRGGSDADNERGGNGWDPSRGGRHGGRQDNGSGGYRDEIRRGLDRVTGGFQAATGRLSGSFRSVGEQLSGPLRAVGERIPRRGGQDSYGGQGGYGAQNPQGGYGGPADPLATRVGSMSDPYPTRAEPGGPGFPGGRGPGGYGGPGGPGPGGPGGRGPGGPGRPPGGPRARRKGDWWRHWTWKKAAVVVGSSFAVFVLLLVGAYFYLSSSVAIPDALASGITDQTSTVYYSDGKTPIGYFSAENRTDLTYGQIPQNLQNAVLAAEERSYWTDGAISPTGILRAAYDDLTSSGGSLSGGSTITQEFVRQYYDYSSIGTQQTASRKIKEIFVAMKLSKAESKQWVLTNYLNTIYLGDDSYGVQAAAQTYFGEPVSKLTIAQDAVIAAIIQQPANYPSKQYRSALVSRWHYVLSGLVKMNDLSQAQANAMKFPTLLTDSPNFSIAQQFGIANPHDVWAPYVMNVVANELEDSANGYTESKLETGGYKIVTSISKPMEQEIYKAVNSNVQQMAAQGGPLPAYALIGAELQNPSNGQIIAMYPGIGQVGVSAKKCAQKDCRLNTAIYAREQVGSSFKPYVLSEAVLQGMNVKTSILDGYGPQSWIPPDSMGSTFSVNNKNQAQSNWYPVTNDGNVNYGPMSVQNAFAQSSNVAFTDLIHKVGTQNVINLAQQFGVNTGAYASGGSGLQDDHGEVGIALGIAAISVNEQDTMLATIDNGGTYHEPHLIVSATAPGQDPVLGKYDVHEVMNPAQAAQVQWAMSTVVTNGTAAGNVNLANSREVIAKTGTTDNAQSAFFIGAIPQYALTVGIWTENQSNTTTQTLNGLGGSSAGGFGGAWPASIWNTFANAEFTQLPVQNFTQPVFTGAKWVQVKPPPKKKAQPKPSNTPSCQSGNPSCSGGGKGGKGPGGGGPTAPVTTQPTTQPPTCKPGHQSCSTPSPTGTPTGGNPSSTPSTGPVGLSVSAEPAAVQSGLAVGGVVSVVPGSLLWTMASRRRRRRAREKERKAA
jgi:membrane peptidoglycan carboxypeptidase